MGKIRRIDPELKAQILKRIKEDGVSVAQASKDHAVHESTIYGWLSSGVSAAPDWRMIRALKKENALLTTLVGEMAVQISRSQKNR